ncbi:MAG TPA: helix-turn-helix domain-containing protein [Vicinamibacterales bacterium]|nr:helix-turn-helix domain-containing protein [Vicinamibacterales bacterium]
MTAGATDAYLPLKALSSYAGLSVRTLRGYLTDRTRPLTHFRVGGKILVRRSDFDAWVSQFRVSCASTSVDALVDDVVGAMR